MRRTDVVGIVLVLLMVALDQCTKQLVESALALHESVPVVDSFFRLTYVRNTGAAFGLFSSAAPSLASVALTLFSLAAIVILTFLWIRARRASALYIAAIALILGGAVGNLVDRLLRGEVIDFIDLYWDGYHWPAFNLADSAITVGVFLFIIQMVFQKEQQR
jgi:signal peptidase II